MSHGFATYGNYSDSEVWIRFHQVGSYERFNRLLENFKNQFQTDIGLVISGSSRLFN